MTTEGFALLLLLLAAAEAGRRSEALWKAAATQGRGAVGNIGGSEDKPCAPPSPPQLVHDPAPSRPFQTGLLPEASGTSPNPSPPSATHAPTAAAGHDRAGSRSGAEMVYIGAHGVETLKRYRYIGQDHSVVAKYVLQPFWTRCVTLFPLWMPNYRYAMEKHRERKGIGAAERFVLGKPSRVQLNWIGD